MITNSCIKITVIFNICDFCSFAVLIRRGLNFIYEVFLQQRGQLEHLRD